jgi:hypothetical protein
VSAVLNVGAIELDPSRVTGWLHHWTGTEVHPDDCGQGSVRPWQLRLGA